MSVREDRSMGVALTTRRMLWGLALSLLASGSARAQFPVPTPSPSPSGTGVTAQAGNSTSAFVLTGTDQGPQVVQDQNTIQQYGQAFAGTQWSFKETSPARNGVSQGEVTITAKGGQPLFPQPGVYFDVQFQSGGATLHGYDVYYSNKQVIISGTVYHNPQSPSSDYANIFYTVIGSDGTPTSARTWFPVTFSQ